MKSVLAWSEITSNNSNFIETFLFSFNWNLKKYILWLENYFNSIFIIDSSEKTLSKLDILDSIDSKRFNTQDPSCSENCLKIENSIQWQCRITPRYLQEIKFNGKFNFSRLLPPSFFITFTSFSILFLGIIAQWGQFFYEVDFDITKSVIWKDIFWHNLLKIRKSFNNVV